MAEDLVIRVIGDDAGFSAVMRRVDRSIQQASGSVRTFGHSTVSNTQAASASIRLMEGDMNNMVRAAENFVGRIPALSNALRIAFPVVGAIAIVSVMAEGIERLDEFRQKAVNLPQALENAFDKITISSMQVNDSLAVSNDKLEAQIALLQGNPPNNLQTALDEDREAADKLAKSLQDANSEIARLLKTNHSNYWDSLFNGNAGTSHSESTIDRMNQHLFNLSDQKANALQNGDTQGAAAIQTQINKDRASYIQTLNDRIKKAQAYDAQVAKEVALQRIDLSEGVRTIVPEKGYLTTEWTGSRKLNVLDMQGEIKQLQAEEKHEQQLARQQKDQDKLKQLQRQKEAARAYAEKIRQQSSALEKSWENQLLVSRAQRPMTSEDILGFWEQAMGTSGRLPLAFNYALKKADSILADEQEKNASLKDQIRILGMTRAQSTTTWDGNVVNGTMSAPDLSKDSTNTDRMRADGDAAALYIQGLQKLISIQQQSVFVLKRQSIALGEHSGELTKLQAAQETATLDTQQYVQALGDLQDALQNVKADPALSSLQKMAKATAISDQIEQLKVSRQVQVNVDDAAINEQTLSGSLHKAFAMYVEEATDTAQQIESLMNQAFESLNSSLAESLMAPSLNGSSYRMHIEDSLGSAFRGIGSSMMDKVFTHVEGSLFKGLMGHGKPDGTASNPLYVKITSHDDAGERAIQRARQATGMMGTASHLFQGFFAGGGSVMADRMAIVGERGPGLFVPHTAGTIIPNHALGGTIHHHHHINVESIDARGAHDPAAVEAAVHRGMKQVINMTPRIALEAVVDYTRRTPSSRRKF